MTLSRVGHLRASRNGLILDRHLRYPQGFADSVTLSRSAWLTKLCVRTIIGAIIPALMHRIPSELRSAIIPALMHRIPSELRRHLRASRNGLILDRHLRYPQGFADSVTLSRAAWLTKLCVRTIIGAIIPALMHRIPSELRI
ncbi:hypothetical protein AHAS_Ahas06G0162200 [Arachis hypogaea]